MVLAITVECRPDANGPTQQAIEPADGTFLLQIGKAGETAGSSDTNLLGRPAEMAMDPGANEVYISDGYLNRCIIVFDTDTGDYKRH